MAVDTQTEKLEELQWARILVKLNGEELPNVVEIRVEEDCYVLTLWWEVRLLMRIFLVDKCGKKVGVEEEVGGEVFARARKRVMMENDDSWLEALVQSTDGTRG